jgi:DNA polymerase-4
MERDILHLAIPAFPVALARVLDSSLRERPVAVVPGHSERALLQCVSSEARAEGVHEGMSVYHARRFCPALILLPPDQELAGRGMRAIEELSGRFSPILEPGAPGRLFLDLTGSRRLFGPGRDAAARLEREIKNGLRLSGSVGVAGNKLVSRIAAGYLEKPGVCDIPRGSERSFIGPLPVSVLPGVGRAREIQLLQDLNLRLVEEIAALSVARLRLALGPFAPLLHQRSRGVDPSLVQPPKRSQEISEESFLSAAENDDTLLMAALCRLVEGCAMRLRRLGKQAGQLTLTLMYADGVTEQGTSRLTEPQNLDILLFAAAGELFLKSCRRRVRLKGMRLVCGRLGDKQGQLDLFANEQEAASRTEALQTALDNLRGKYGMDSLRWGRDGVAKSSPYGVTAVFQDLDILDVCLRP